MKKGLINNNLPQSPCQFCKRKKMGCHSECADFIDFEHKSEEVKAMIYQKTLADTQYDGFRKERARRFYKKKR